MRVLVRIIHNSVHSDHRVRVWVCYEHRTSQVAYRREGALACSIGTRIRVLRVKVSLGATRAHVSVCFMLHSDCAAYVHLRCSHGHGAGAEFRSKQYADEAESAKITSSSATFP